MGLFSNDHSTNAAIQAGARYIDFLERNRVALLRALRDATEEATELKDELAGERQRRARAEADAHHLDEELHGAARVRELVDQRVAELEDRVAALTRELEQDGQRDDARDDVCDRECADDDEDLLEEEATRQRILRQQALRARLAKRDMSPPARLRQTPHAAGSEPRRNRPEPSATGRVA